MFLSRNLAESPRCAGWFNVLTLLAAVSIVGAALAAEPKTGSQADSKPTAKADSKPEPKSGTQPASKADAKPGSKTGSAPQFKPETEIDISGPYNAQLNGESYPSTVEIWGTDAILKVSIDGQDKPMLGGFLNNQLKVLFKYGAANFNLTTMVQAQYDGWSFNGQYNRADEKLGQKVAPITLTPAWYHGGGGTPVKMPVPRSMADIPGKYGLSLTKDGRNIYAQAEVELDNGTIKIKAGGREYACDYSPTEMAPVYWEGNRMDTFKITPTENGFKGSLAKEVGGKKEEFEVAMVKGDGTGSGGHDRDWTYVYDVIFNNVAPPVWIGKLTMHEEEADLVINIKGEKASMTGSLVDDILSGTGKYGRSTVSIRAQKNAHGFAGVFRKGSGAAVSEFPVVLKNRAARASAAAAW